MSIKNVNWPLLVRAGEAPAELARKRIFSGGWEALDDAAERFLAGIDTLECSDIVSWLARRRPTDESLPNNVPTNAQLVDRFVGRWRHVDGLNISASKDGTLDLWGIPLRCIDPDTWDDLVERTLPGLVAPSEFLLERDQELKAMCSLHGCEAFAKVCALRREWEFPGREREPLGWPRHPVDPIIAALVPIRRNEGECARELAARAVAAATGDNLFPLWVFARSGLLGHVDDPATVLPARVDFDLDLARTRDEDDLPDTRLAIPLAGYPMSVALAWVGPRRPLALRWLTDRVLDVISSEVDVARISSLLAGPRLLAPELPAWVVKHPFTPPRDFWRVEREHFDDLMRRSIERGFSLSTAWVTVVRDLAARAPDAWSLARRWLEQASLRVVEGEGGGKHIEEENWDGDRWPDVAAHGVESALNARRWIALYAPLPDPLDAAVEGCVTTLLQEFHALGDVWVLDRFRRSPRQLDPGFFEDHIVRIAELPPNAERRATLLEALRAFPHLLAHERAAQVIGRVAPVSADELPSITDLFRFATDRDRLGRVVDGYLELGGGAARRCLSAALHDHLAELMRDDREVALLLAKVCAPFIGDDLRGRVQMELASWHLAALSKNGSALAAAFGVPFDLAAVVRSRIDSVGADFSGLPEGEFVEETLARIAWLAREGEAAHTRARPGPAHLPSCHAEFVDEEILTLAACVGGDGVNRERLLPVFRQRAVHGDPRRAARYFDQLERAGLRRTELVDIACEHFARVDERDPSLADGLFGVATPPLADWLNARMASRSAWDTDGARLIDRLLDAHRWTLGRVCDAALAAKTDAPGDAPTLLDAMLMAFAEAFAARARDALRQGDVTTAHRALRAIMDLDAPSRAYRFLSGLRKLTAGNDQLAAAVEACEHLLRRDTDRAPTADNLHRAMRTFSPGD